MKHSIQVTAFLLSIFLLAQLVGLKVVDNYIDREATAKSGVAMYKALPYSIERPDIRPELSAWFIFAAIIIGTIVLLLFMKFEKVSFWRLWFFLSVIVTLSIALASFIPAAAAFVLSFVFSVWKVFRPNVVVHNLTEVFIYGGLAAIFVPIMNLAAAFILLIIISAYDVFAVWQSRHMVRLAKFQTASNVFAGIYVPGGKSAHSSSSSASAEDKKQAYKARSSRASSSGKGAVLGGGDIGFPLIFAGVVMK
ncbi:hypothetical protein HYU15_00710, partial [Candidatus Woesearchaeota archaeon]|nr:hypothetical protein [Candidatus Woesearchaeota archaeon]